MKWKMTVVATLAICAACVACNRTAPSVAPEPVTIAISATTDSVLAQIAQARGYNRAEGLEATVNLHPYGKLALQEVLEGKADFATVAETPVMFAIMNGARISVIATIESSRRGNAIVASKDRGILTLKELKGKKIGVTQGTTTAYFLDAVLAVNGVGRDEVKTIDMKAEEMTAALVNSEIDAASMFTTYAIPAQRQLGERGIIFHDDNVYTFTFNIVATQEFIRNHPEKVRKVLRALVKAEEFVSQNPDEAQQLVAGFSSVDIGVLRDIWNETTFRVSLDQALILALEDESRWAIKNRLTSATKVPNYLDYVDLNGLRAVKADAVRILR